MARTIFRIILIILLCLTFFQIFQFSNEDSTKSSSRSREVMKKIIDIFPYTKNLSESTKIKIVEKSQPIIRKLAHFSIYALVGILIMTFISTYKLLLWIDANACSDNTCQTTIMTKTFEGQILVLTSMA